MNHVFGYPGVYWSARIFVMLVMAISSWIVLLMLARFFRPQHIRAMIRVDPPKMGEISGEFRGFNTRNEHLDLAKAELGDASIDPEWLEEMRKQSLRAIIAAYGLTIPRAHEMSSVELRLALDAAKPRIEF